MGEKIVIKYVHLKKPAIATERDGTTWILDRTPPVGVVIALDENRIGWSLCAINKGDTFRKKYARSLAIDRAMGDTVPAELPQKLTAVERTDLYEVYEEVKQLAKSVFGPKETPKE